MKSIKAVWRIFFVSAAALLLPVIIDYILSLPASYIDRSTLAGSILYGIQLGITFLLGIVWSVMFLKTKSLLGPVIAHTCANTIQIMSGYIAAYFFI